MGAARKLWSRLALAPVVVVVVLGAPPAGALAGEGCENEARREEQASQLLPECRAYEMVSPVDKNGGDIAAQLTSAAAASDGGAIAYTTHASFGDTSGAGTVGQTTYVARRGSSGWSSHGITPTPNSGALMIGLAFDTAIGDFSPDLRHAVVSAVDLPGVSGAVPNTNNIYTLDTLTGALQLVSLSPPEPFEPFSFFVEFLFPTFGAVSSDTEHVAFASQLPYSKEAPAGVPSVYEWNHGVIRLASILPDGSPAPEGATLPSPSRYRETVSPDGSRVVFLAAPASGSPEQLYARVDHERTVWISEPEMGSPSPAPENVLLQQVTGDSRHVIFTTSSKLLDTDTNGGSDIYMYTESADPEKEANLTLITDTGNIEPTTVMGSTVVIGSSEDGKRIYYYQNGTILLWDEGVTRIVASHVKVGGSLEWLQLSATVSMPGVARVTPNGEYVAFMSSEGSPVDDGSGQAVGDSARHAQLYLYSAKDDTLRCVSCPSGGPAHFDASIEPTVTNLYPAADLLNVRPSFLAGDGKVFFSTADALVPEDINGITDAYEYNPTTGMVSLISTGTGSQPAAFMDASEDGSDIYFATRAQLLRGDRDNLVDIYDARVHGGFAEPPSPPVPCTGEACQRGVSGAPEEAAAGSLTFTSSAIVGSGNAQRARSRSSARKLRNALRACRKRKTSARRKRCESQARRRYTKTAMRASRRSK